MNHQLIRATLLATALAATVTLSACGTDSTDQPGMPGMGGMSGMSASSAGNTSGTSTTQSGTHNAADVTFATNMIPHHAQAVTMGDMALKAAQSPEVKALATEIKAAQAPEIEQMSTWLRGWGAPVPDTMMGDSGHDMGDMSGMSGMMSADDMAALGQRSGAAFDTMWLEMMTRHHEGAIEMARTQLSSGSSPEAKALAQSIIDSQTTEIATMKALLAKS